LRTNHSRAQSSPRREQEEIKVKRGYVCGFGMRGDEEDWGDEGENISQSSPPSKGFPTFPIFTQGAL
jgi:hypothetical protein